MTSKALAFCGWSGIGVVVLSVISMMFLHHFDIPAALISANETASAVRHNAYSIMLAQFLNIIVVALSCSLVAGISAEIRLMEPAQPVLAYLQLALGVAASTLVAPSAVAWSVAAYRPERPAETIQLIADFANFALYLPFSVASLQSWVIAAAILSDRRTVRIFPKWIGWFNLVAGFSYIPMGLLGLVKTGPLAADGVIGFWYPTICVIGWYVLMGLYLIKGAKSWARREVISLTAFPAAAE